MNILVVSPFFPYPLTQGGKITIFNTLKYLSLRHRVSFACLAEEPISDYGPLRDYCEEIVVVERKPKPVKDLLTFLTGDYPYNAVRLHSADFALELKKLLERRTFDLVQIEFSLMWPYAPIFKGIPLVLDAHNIEYQIIRQNRINCRNPVKKLLYAIEERKLRELEERAWRECTLCFTVSVNEMAVISSTLENDHKLITMVGVDLARFEFQVKQGHGTRLLFVGGLNYHPNLDSAQYLLREISPLLRACLPEVKLDIVGQELWRVAGLIPENSGVEMHENVPEILSWFRGADLLVVPLRQGAGIRIKILEAMAAGLPVVTTSKGCEGLQVEHGRELLIADDPVAFANEVVRLLGDHGLRRTLAENARSFVAQYYSWETVVERMVNGYHRILDNKGV